MPPRLPPDHRARRRREFIRDVPWLILAHVLVRFWAARRGVRFDDRSLEFFWQFLGPTWLRERPLEALSNLHAQPPLFNALLAATGVDGPTLGWIFFALGLFIPAGIYLLVRGWTEGRGSRAAALVAALAWSLSPTSILYGHWLFYTLPVAAMLVGLAVAMTAHERAPSPRRFAWVCALLILVTWTRSAFHLLWAAATLFAIAWPSFGRATASAPRRRATKAAIALTLGLLILPYAHNAYRFGFFGTSSWMGFSLSKLAINRDDPATVAELRRAHPVDCRFAHEAPFAPIDHYRELARTPDGTPPELANLRQPNRHLNLNHLGYVEASRLARACSFHAIRRDPAQYFGQVHEAATRFWQPPSRYWFLDDNAAKIEPWVAAWESAAPAPWAIALLMIAAAWGCLRRTVAPNRAPTSGVRSQRIVVATLAYYIVTTSLLEIGENERFAAAIWPLMLAILGSASVRLAPSLIRLARRPSRGA